MSIFHSRSFDQSEFFSEAYCYQKKKNLKNGVNIQNKIFCEVYNIQYIILYNLYTVYLTNVSQVWKLSFCLEKTRLFIFKRIEACITSTVHKYIYMYVYAKKIIKILVEWYTWNFLGVNLSQPLADILLDLVNILTIFRK